MKANILFIADGDIDSDLEVIDAATRTDHGVRRATVQSRPAQILRRSLRKIDVVIVDLDQHGHGLEIVEMLGGKENGPPVIALTNEAMAPLAYRHGAAICVTKPFTASDLASVIKSLCAHNPAAASARASGAISVATPHAPLREPAD